jgi:hypothetical protein
LKSQVPAFLVTALLLIFGAQLFAQAPNITYTSPQTLIPGAAVTISPVNAGGAIPATPGYAISTFAGSVSQGNINATGTAARFYNPKGIAKDASGNFYIADAGNNNIRMITPLGVVTIFAGSTASPGTAGLADGTTTAARFSAPSDITIDPSGNFYVADYANNSIRKITSAGVVSTLATVTAPAGIAYNSVTGALYVTSYTAHNIIKVTLAGATSIFAGSTTGVLGRANGTTTAATFFNPSGITDDNAGNIFVADQGNNEIRQITTAGVVSLLAGSATGIAGAADGTGSAASFKYPSGITFNNGIIYVGDTQNNKIRMIAANNGVVTTIAGTGTAGSADGAGNVATFNGPYGLQTDASGSLFIADYYANEIRKLVPGGGYVISNTLPAGLSFNSATGVISGTPTTTFAASDYTITAFNATGTSSFTLNLAVSTYTLSAPVDNNATVNTASAYSPIGTVANITALSTFGGNLALNKSATASSYEILATYPASSVTDGATTGARWSSLPLDPQYIYIDLGNTYTITGVNLYWQTAFGSSYRIDVSNTAAFTTYTTIYSTTTGDGGLDAITPTASASGQYIRMYGTAHSSLFSGYSLYEFQVYGIPAITYSLTGVPSSYFTIDANTGIVTLNSASVPPGTYAVGVNARAEGITSASTNFSIIVSTATPTISSPAITGCAGALTLTAAGGLPSGGVYNWYNVAAGGTVLATGTTYAPPVSGTYYVDYTAAGTTSPRSLVKAVTINPAPFVAQTAASGLQYSYPFSGNATDAMGLNDGTVQNGAPLTTDRYGAANSAYGFNGSTQYISTATQIPSPGPQQFTISLWFKSAAGAAGGRLLGFGDVQSGGNSANYDRQIYMTAAGQLVFGVYSGTTDTIRTGKTYNDNIWHQVSASFSAATGTKLYLDGVLASSNAAQVNAQSIAGYWRIGYDNLNGWPAAPTNWYFTGSLDDVQIYNRILSANEVYSLQGVKADPVCVGSTLSLFAKTLTGATYSWTGPNSFTSSTQNPTIANVSSVNAGTYTVTVTSSTGCVSTITGVATFYALPAAVFTATAAVDVNANATITLTSTYDATSTYTWDFNSGTPATSTGSGPFSVKWASTGIKTVTLTIINANGCTSVSTQTVAVGAASLTGYAFKKQLVLNNAAVGMSADQTNFPALVYIQDNALIVNNTCSNQVQYPTGNYSGALVGTNYDFAFLNPSSTTELNYQVENYNPVTGTLLVWVKIPTLYAATNNTLSFYFGSLTPAHSAATIAATWPSDYQAVYHFNEGSTTATVLDATSNARNAAQTNTTVATDGIRYAMDPTGTIISGGAYKFNGVTTSLAAASNIIQNAGLAPSISGTFTLSAWVNATNSSTVYDEKIVTNQNNYGYGYKMSIKGTSATTIKLETEIRSGTYPAAKLQNAGAVSTTSTTTPAWHYIQSIYDGTSFKNYVDGVLIATAAGYAPSLGTNIYIGIDYRGTTTLPEHVFLGTMDEVRISNVAKSADWIAAEYSNQTAPLTFTDYSAAVTTNQLTAAAIPGALVYTYTGTTNGNFTDATKWTNTTSGVANLAPPTDGTASIVIPATTNVNMDVDASVYGVTLNAGTSLTLQGHNLNVGCNVYNQATGRILFSGLDGSKITWNGNLANQAYYGGTTTGYAHLGSMEVNNSVGGTITVNADTVDIYHELKITKGNLAVATGAIMILKSTATQTAYVTSLPLGTSITGTVNVERYIAGSLADLSRRGYRLLSSPVNAATVAGANVYDLNYFKTYSIVTGVGGATNGFTTGTSSTANASIYIFREDILSSNFTFASGNFKGITQLNKTPSYLFGVNAKGTLTNTNDASTYLPVGNGILFFFRGGPTLNTATATGTKTTSPYDYPENTTLVQSGTLNSGTITVQSWVTGTTNLSYTTTITNNVAPGNIRGYNLLGNPYASTINWEKYNRNGTNSSIYGSNSLPATLYQFNATTKQYASYQQKATVNSVADTTSTIIPTGAISSDGVVSNMISSGQAFFVVANTATQTLTFRESAKTTTQPTQASVLTLMSTTIPRSGDQAFSFMRLKLAKDSINTDAVSIVLNNENNAKYMVGEDAVDMGGNGALVSLSALSTDSVALSIDRLPLPTLKPEIIPISVSATSSGLYSLNMEQLKDLPAIYQVWLMDDFKKDSLDMRAYKTYNFNIDKSVAGTYGKSRFRLVIRQNAGLALRLLDFNGTKASTGVKLNWKVENESNYTNFTVERSTDGGKTFEVIGGLSSNGGGTYTLTDKNPVAGTDQYRLKQDDINGTISYSKPVNVMYANTTSVADNSLTVFPNPVSDVVNVSINSISQSDVAAVYTIRITNAIGILVKTTVSNKPSWQDNVSNLYPGTYFIQVINNVTKAIIGKGKFVKL